MNEPLVTLSEAEDGLTVRRFANGDTPPGRAAVDERSRAYAPLVSTIAEPARARAAQLGHAAATLVKIGLRLVAGR